MTARITSLDYLRGLCALSIMVYHYLVFSGLSNFDSNDFLRRMGFYGVSIFYILSGLTLYLVYHKNFSLKDFYIKRFFRIYPLLWVTITLSIIIHGVRLNATALFLNYTGLFGLFKWWGYIGTGVWSIGNELAFYLLFPIFLIPARRHKSWVPIMLLVFYVFYFWFAYIGISHQIAIQDQWRDYVNPLNQVALFVTGFAIGYYLKNLKIDKVVSLIVLFASIVLFIFYPTKGDAVTLVTNDNRIFFTALSTLIVIAFFKLDISVPVVSGWLKLLGEASYSLYLLHPLVWVVFTKLKTGFDPAVSVAICIVLSVISSIICYRYFEKPFMDFGKRLIN